MKRDYVDFFLVPDNQLAIHSELENWAAWVRVRPCGWQVSPMFRLFRSNWRQWHVPDARPMTNIPEAVAMEKLVSGLPEKYRDAIRWAYVACNNPSLMAQRLGTNKEGLLRLVQDGRIMLRNRKVSDER